MGITHIGTAKLLRKRRAVDSEWGSRMPSRGGFLEEKLGDHELALINSCSPHGTKGDGTGECGCIKGRRELKIPRSG